MIAVGDTVVIGDRHPGGKFCTPYEKETWTVNRVQGTMITARQRQNQITRNVSFFKRAMADTSVEGDEVDFKDGGLSDVAQPMATTAEDRSQQWPMDTRNAQQPPVASQRMVTRSQVQLPATPPIHHRPWS